MGLRDLFFNLTAKDQTAAAFKKVRENVRGVDDAVARASQNLTAWGGKLAKVGAGITAFAAPMLLAFRDSLSVYQSAEVANARLEAALKSTGRAATMTRADLQAMARGLQDLTGHAEADILGGITTQFLALDNIQGEVFNRAHGLVLDVATALGTDLRGAAKSVGEALQDPINGVGALGEAGVRFTDKQKALIKSLVEGGKIAEAQTLILDALAQAMGGQAVAAADAGGRALTRFNDAVRDVKVFVGGVIADVLPPFVDFFKTMVDGFMGLPEPMRRFITVAGLVTVALGALGIAAGAAAIALGALSAPVLLAGAAVAGLVGLVAALWPETEKVAQSADNVTLAMGDEITQSQLLAQALSGNTTMSVEAAKQKLAEARSRHENVKAIIAEQRALKLQSTEYKDVLKEIDDTQAVLNGIGFPAIDVAVAERRDAFEMYQQRLVTLRNRQMDLLKADAALEEQFKRTEENVAALEAGLAAASNGVVTFGDAVITPITPLDRLGVSATGAGDAVGAAMDQMKDKAKDAQDALEGIGGDVSAALSRMATEGKLSMSSLSDALLSIGMSLRDRLLKMVFDPIGDAAEAMFKSFLDGASGSGGGGILGGIGKALGSALGGLAGFDLGGSFTAGGRAGVDRNIAAFRVSAGETVSISRRGQATPSPVVVNIQTPSPAAFKASQGQIGAMIARAAARGQRAT